VVQRAVAEQLDLPSWVMEKFGQQDEEDDFDGLEQGSRGAISYIGNKIREMIEDRGFVLVLHNGGNKQIDLRNLGLSDSRKLCSVFWTF
jgi:hypothetical protein